MSRKQRRAAAKLGNVHATTATAVLAPDAANLLSMGLEHHRAGRLAQAETCYRQALVAQPNHADALHLLGVAARQAGRHAEAVELIRRAIQRNGQNPGYFWNLGTALNSQGNLNDAVVAYAQAIRIKPDYAEAHANLGVALYQQGKLDEAVAAYAQAIRIKPDYAEAYFNLAAALYAQGKLGEAAAAYAQAARIRPDWAEAHYNQGNALNERGKLAEALSAYARAIKIKPDYADAHCNLGNVLKKQSKRDEAIAAYAQAILIKPDYAEAHSNLGLALNEQRKHGEAVAALRRAISIRPDYAPAHCNLGVVLNEQGKHEEAAAALRHAIAIEPDFAEAYSNLGNALSEQGRRDEAFASYTQAIRIKPDHAQAHYNFGVALKEAGRLAEAASAFRHAIRIRADHVEAHCNLGVVLKEQGKLDEAVAAYRRAIGIEPDYADALSNLLFGLNYVDTVGLDRVFAAHREWDERYGRQASRPAAYANTSDARRRLKVGYLSPDFREHSVAYFLEPLLVAHDHESVEVYCYAEVTRPDAVTHRLKALADHWLVTVGMSDDALVHRIGEDSIDILVDLAGHTGSNRLRVFARKPAPIQVTWLGYPNTTGLSSIDYRLVDTITDPQGSSDAFASETLMRLEGGFLCYRPVADAPQPSPPPSLASGIVTFGSFNNPAKLSAATLDVWAALLNRRPEARLLLKGFAFADADTRALLLARLGERGVAAERVELMPWQPGAATHLSGYHRVDVALDPFPYNGTTTTCEALWMGVPVVTRTGDRHAARVGASLLTQVGLIELVASSAEEYVQVALALANDPERLTELRHSLRLRVAASPLCDAHAFARKMETAYRAIWQNWCEAQMKPDRLHQKA